MTESRSAELRPAELRSVELRPAEPCLTEPRPAELRPAESRLAETGPAGKRPVEPRPAGAPRPAAFLAEPGPTEPTAADLLCVPPPEAPLLHLRPSRMTMSRLTRTGMSALRPDLTAWRLRIRLREWSARAECVFTASGRTALWLALVELGAGPGSEVVLSTFNPPAVADAILACGATPVFVDFDPDTGPAFGSVPLNGRIVVLTNGLGRDEWAAHAADITARGGRIVLDLAQASPAVLRGYADTDCPIVLSFGEGKSLGGLGGGALLSSRELVAGPASGDGAAALARAVAERAMLRAPAQTRSAMVREQFHTPTTKADDLPAEPGPVPSGGIDRWELAAAAVMLDSAERVRSAMTRLHERVRALLDGALRTCVFPDVMPALCPTLDLVFHRPGDRLRFGRELAARGVPAMWHHYPLHRTPAYARLTSLPAVDRLWPRVLSVPKLPQPRLTAGRLARALLAADTATFEGCG